MVWRCVKVASKGGRSSLSPFVSETSRKKPRKLLCLILSFVLVSSAYRPCSSAITLRLASRRRLASSNSASTPLANEIAVAPVERQAVFQGCGDFAGQREVRSRKRLRPPPRSPMGGSSCAEKTRDVLRSVQRDADACKIARAAALQRKTRQGARKIRRARELRAKRGAQIRLFEKEGDGVETRCDQSRVSQGRRDPLGQEASRRRA